MKVKRSADTSSAPRRCEKCRRPIPTLNPPRYRPPHRFRQSIRPFPSQAGLLIPMTEFQDLVREITRVVAGESYRMRPAAIGALQESTEAFVAGLFSDMALEFEGQERTPTPRDVQLARRIRGAP